MPSENLAAEYDKQLAEIQQHVARTDIESIHRAQNPSMRDPVWKESSLRQRVVE
jgi:hypothetical protein